MYDLASESLPSSEYKVFVPKIPASTETHLVLRDHAFATTNVPNAGCWSQFGYKHFPERSGLVCIAWDTT